MFNSEVMQKKVGEIAEALLNCNYGDAERKARQLYSALCPKCEGKGYYVDKIQKPGEDEVYDVRMACSCCDLLHGGYGMKNEEPA